MKYILKLNTRVVIDSATPLDIKSAALVGLGLSIAAKSNLVSVHDSEVIELLDWEAVENKPEPFDIWRSFESVEEAIEYCKKYEDPTARIEDLAHHHIGLGEYGFTRDLLEYL